MANSHDSLMRLSVEAYLLARECGRIAGIIPSVQERFSDGQISVLSEELSFFHSRMLLVGGYLAGFVTVEEDIDLASEKKYMESCRSLLTVLNSVLEA